MSRFAVAYALAIAPLWAYQTPCDLTGRVLDYTTGNPLTQAEVTLTNGDFAVSQPQPQFTAKTSQSGQFAFQAVQPGRYRLSASQDGFAGPRNGQIVSLSPTDCPAPVLLRLQAFAAVVGKVLLEDGQPAVNAQVAVMRVSYGSGPKRLAKTAAELTNDLGEYRVFGIPPGRYVISASPSPPLLSTPRSASEADPREAYGATFYPGETDASMATPIDVRPGSTSVPLVILLRKRLAVRVQGRIVGEPQAVRGARVVLAAPTGMVQQTRATDDGAFAFDDVTSGIYTIGSTAQWEGKGLVGSKTVTVGAVSLDGVQVALTSRIEIHGKVRSGKSTPPGLTVNLFSNLADSSSPAVRASVSPNGNFVLVGVAPAEYHIELWGLPENFNLQSARLGPVDALSGGLDLTNAVSGDLDLVVSDKAGSVTGTVRDEKGTPVTGATVVLIPQFAGRDSRIEFQQVTSTDQNGGFVLKGLCPGDYSAYAWSDIEPFAWMDPGLAPGLRGKGQKVTLAEAGAEKLNLTVMP